MLVVDNTKLPLFSHKKIDVDLYFERSVYEGLFHETKAKHQFVLQALYKISHLHVGNNIGSMRIGASTKQNRQIRGKSITE